MKLKYILLILFAVIPAMTQGQSSNCNYVQTVTYLDADRTDSIISIQYYDGLGRPEQMVTGGANTQGKYLHSYQTYDGCGREETSWVPVVGHNTPDYMPLQVIQTSGTYEDSMPYTTVSYDALDRPVFVTTPGSAWQGRGKGTAYSSNKENEVILYRYGNLSSTSHYGANTLYCTESEDEDGHTVKVFKDLQGKTLLERRYLDRDSADTYYVYNDFDQLVYVLPPMYQEEPDLDKYAFQYTYDYRGRISSKKLPGCSPIHYEYDNADRIRRMQDGVLAEQGKWRVYEYDRIGRMTRQGISNGNGIRYDEIVNYYDNYIFLTDYASDAQLLPLLSPKSQGHSRGMQTGALQRASNGEILLSVLSYDDYGRIDKQVQTGLNGQVTVSCLDYNFVGDVTKDSTQYYERRADGRYDKVAEFITINKYEAPHTKLLTSSLLVMKRAENGVMKIDTTVIQQPTYDEFGHVVANDRSGTAADMQYAYDNLHGWVTQIQSAGGFEQNLYRETGGAHPCFNGNISAMTWQCGTSDPLRRYDYIYDGLNRLTEATYNELLNASLTEESPEYRNNNFWDDEEDNTIDIIPRPDNPVFRNRYGEAMTYDRNSNITTMQRYGMRNDRSYGLIDNLSVSYYGNQRRSIDDAVTEALTYAGASDFVDKQNRGAEYDYNANGALTKDLNRGITNIEYDLLGNPKKITMTGNRSIEYIYSADGRRLRTIHSKPKLKDGPIIGVGPALGMNNSISKSGISTDPNALRPVTLAMDKDSTDYCGSLILRNAHPSQYLFSGGYASFDADTLSGWHYYVQDYMGNNRMVVNANTNSVEQETHYYPYGGVIGDISTNESLQSYKFEGKELDRTFGLDWYDIQARQYDAIGGTWYAIDPLAEKTPEISPYVMCAGNPVNYGDYDGRKTIWINGFDINMSRDDLGTYRYWDNDIRYSYYIRFQDTNNSYIDGSLCGLRGTIVNGDNLICQNRIEAGYKRGKLAAEEIIRSLRREKGQISEVLRIVTHSMGSAFAKGYVKAIMEFVIAHPEMCNGFAIIEYDLAPYQPAEQQAVENVETIQYSHSKDRVAGNCGIVGAINGDAMQDEDQGHKNKTFITTIQNLPEGRYRYINGRFVYTGPVQTQH